MKSPRSHRQDTSAFRETATYTSPNVSENASIPQGANFESTETTKFEQMYPASSIFKRTEVMDKTDDPNAVEPPRINSATGEPYRQENQSITRKIFSYIALTKPRIIELLLVCTVPTMFFAAHGWPGNDLWSGLWLVIITFFAGALSAGGAQAFNSYFDRDIDRHMKRTVNRPLVTGAVSPRGALVFAWTLSIISTLLFALFTNWLATIINVIAIFFYVVLYTQILKRRTKQNIVWGGIAGCMPVLIAWAATVDVLQWGAWILFGVVFLWTPAHYWPLSLKYRKDYARADVPMLGAIDTEKIVSIHVSLYGWAMVICSLLLVPLAGAGWVYVVIAGCAGLWFMTDSYRLYFAIKNHRGDEDVSKKAMHLFHLSIVYLSLVFLGVALDPFLYFHVF